jgi:hypothetical protein
MPAMLATAEDGLIYLTECTLATVEILADMQPSPPGELNRQCAIAQRGLDLIRSLSLADRSPSLSSDEADSWRVAVLLKSGQRVREWAWSGKEN